MPDTSPPRQPGRNNRIPFFTNLIATGLFSGYSPVASGTAGSLVGVALYCIPGMSNSTVLGAAIIAAFFAGVVTSARVASIVGDRINADALLTKKIFQKGSHEEADPSIVVIDEIVGMWIALLFLPMTWPAVFMAFFFFRLFDIIKPYPAARLERIPHGWGIMLDDVAAGIYANIAVQILLPLAGRFL
jgi:phosphatidylglycerophosphatase A